MKYPMNQPDIQKERTDLSNTLRAVQAMRKLNRWYLVGRLCAVEVWEEGRSTADNFQLASANGDDAWQQKTTGNRYD